jgi:hypothetical protein
MKRTLLGPAIVFAASFAVVSAQSQSTGSTPSGQSPSGQHQAGTSSDTNFANQNDNDRGQSVTLVGCVQQDPGARSDEFILANASIGSEAGTAASTTSDPSAPPAAGSATGTSGSATGSTSGTSGSTTGTPGSMAGHEGHASGSMAGMHGAAGVASSYELTGDREDDLQQYVGQRVEITGTVEEANTPDPSMSGSSTSGAAGTSGSGAAGTAAGTSGSSAGATGSESASAGTSASGSADAPAKRLRITSFRAVGGNCAPAGGNR